MKRKEFLTAATKVGVCSCIGVSMFSSPLFASDDEKKQVDGRIPFMQKRFKKLIDAIKENATPEQTSKIISALGKACGEESKSWYTQYISNVDGMLNQFKQIWVESAEYDKAKGIIKIYGKKTGQCGCPFVDNSKIDKAFCNCSLSYQKEIWKNITGKNADVSITESVLFGSDRCCFEIRLS